VPALLGEGDLVAFRFVVRATHTGTFGAFPATGRRVTLVGIDLVRLTDERLVELWTGGSELDWVRQLGAVVTPPVQVSAT
jgi:predicted ester cyclase